MKIRYLLITALILLLPVLVFGINCDVNDNGYHDITCGGTDAGTAADARTNLGALAPGTTFSHYGISDTLANLNTALGGAGVVDKNTANTWGARQTFLTVTTAPATGAISGLTVNDCAWYTKASYNPGGYTGSATYVYTCYDQSSGYYNLYSSLGESLATIPRDQAFTILDPANGDDPLIWKMTNAATITYLDCVSLGGGDIDVDIQECDANGANCATTGATLTDVTTTNQQDSSFTNASIDAGDWLKMVLTNDAGTLDQLSCRLRWTEP